MDRPSPSKIANDLANEYMRTTSPSFEQRLSTLKRTTGVRPEDVEEYRKTEILRRAREEVQRIATKNSITRLSPKRLYSGVKSKVAGNLASQKKAVQSRPSVPTKSSMSQPKEFLSATQLKSQVTSERP
jgi:hypothetical protein